MVCLTTVSVSYFWWNGHITVKRHEGTPMTTKRYLSTVARSLRQASKLTSITELDLSSSDSFICKNMMCEYVGESCICRLALWTHQNQDKLSSLTTLNLARNALAKLPDTIFDFNTLEHLDLSFNQLEEIPASVKRLSSLSSLDLRGNPLRQDASNKELVHQLTHLQQCKVLVDD